MLFVPAMLLPFSFSFSFFIFFFLKLCEPFPFKIEQKILLSQLMVDISGLVRKKIKILGFLVSIKYLEGFGPSELIFLTQGY